MSRLEKEIYKNRRLMRFNTSLTINEQTDTITITPRMFERLVEDDTFKPLIYESIQKELDKVRNKELKYIPFGDVSDFISKPTPNQVDLNPFVDGATDLPCPTCLAYDVVQGWSLSAGINTLTLKDIDGDNIKLKATGWVGIENVKIPIKVDLKANYSLKEDYLYYSIKNVDISSDVKIPIPPFKVGLSYSKIKITNNFWCDGTCWRIDPGLEAAIKKNFGTKSINIRPYIEQL